MLFLLEGGLGLKILLRDMLESEWPSITEVEQFLKLNNTDECGTNAVKKTSYSPEWCGSVAWTTFCKPKSRASMFLSFSLSLPPPLSKKINKINIHKIF